MKAFERGFLATLSIKHKFTLVMMFVSCGSLFLACTGLIVREMVTFRQSMVEELSTIAHVLGSNSAGALMFNDPAFAKKTLATMSSEPHILKIEMYDTKGNLFASYRRAHASRDAISSNDPSTDSSTHRFTGKVDGHRFLDNQLELSRQIVFDKETIGSIFLWADLNKLRTRLINYISINFVVVVAVALSAYFLSFVLRRVISNPVVELAGLMNRVSSEKDYSLRMVSSRRDEMGVLSAGFNAMLEHIQLNEEMLRKHNESLEELVEERTA